ncbi:MAG: hydrogenase assembly protein HupF [Acidithiobacillales bacterium SM23_46]|nr:MAG: hydrogenase assembly protein HupF [Acidithiobacillales bacterium SM23_46]
MISTAAAAETARKSLAHWAEQAARPLTLMEVCGTHTMAIHRHGILSLLPENVRLISGPGCPVCVTPQGQVDQIVALARQGEATVATFGDMVRVPGSTSSLERERALGADVRVVYSPLDAVALAEALPSRHVVFIGIGFETTVPTVAAAVIEARRRRLGNFTILAAGKRIPPALDALLASGELRVDGLICPGHVSVVIGWRAYEPFAQRHRLPCAVAGFEPTEVLEAIVALVRQAAEGRADVENLYSVWVRPEGNRRALKTLESVFVAGPSRWRGLGIIERSGLLLREEWSDYDAARRFGVEEHEVAEPSGCRCGDVLRGILAPADCALFARACTPESPVGPCMVSTEGSCAAAYRYGRRRGQ